jgi:hypothetical protein
VKKETVNGIIGKTQGVSKPIKPPRNPRIKMPHKLFALLSSMPVPPQVSTGLLVSIFDRLSV